MLHAFAHGEHAPIGRLHKIVDHDSAIHRQPGFTPQLHVRLDAGRDHHQVGVHGFAVFKPHAFHVSVPEQRLGRLAGEHPHAELLDPGSEIPPARGIELHVHQRIEQVHHGDFGAANLQPTRRFQAQQAAADHHGADAGPRQLDQRARVIEVAKREHTGLVDSIDRRNEGRAARSQQNFVERRVAAVVAGNQTLLHVDADDAHA